jgi:hypothetical protein
MSDKKLIGPEPAFRTGRYHHYKGGEYEAFGLAMHEASLEWHVMYRPLRYADDAPKVWLRRLDDFMDSVQYQGKSVPRFVYIDKQP